MVLISIKNEDMGQNPSIEVSELTKLFAALTTMVLEVSRGETSQYFFNMQASDGTIKFVNRRAGVMKDGENYYE